MSQNNLIVNEEIKANKVRLIIEEGEKPTILLTKDALHMASQRGLDLIVISETGEFPVCKITNASKYRYNLQKAEKERLKKQRAMTMDTKEIYLRPVTDKNDIIVKAKKANQFLKDGHKVNIAVKFRGRELSRMDAGREVINSILTQLSNYKIETPVSVSDRKMFTLISPQKG